MAGRVGHDDDVMAEINVTPLVDVMLVLLIIFMVTATFMKDPVIPVNVPKAATAQNAPANSVSVVLDGDGVIFVGGEEVTRWECHDLVEAALVEDSDTSIVIAADGTLEYNRVAALIDLVKKAGAREFSLSVQRPVTASLGGGGSS